MQKIKIGYISFAKTSFNMDLSADFRRKALGLLKQFDNVEVVDAGRLITLETEATEAVKMFKEKGDVWYVAGLNGDSERTAELDISWLPEGKYIIELFTDGVNAEKFATDYKREIISSGTGKTLEINMVTGGGFVARVYQ